MSEYEVPDSAIEAVLDAMEIGGAGTWAEASRLARAVIDAWEAHIDAVDIAAAEAALAEGSDPVPADEMWQRLEATP